MSIPADLTIRAAIAADAELLLSLIRDLAEFEKLADQVVATSADLERELFGTRPAAEALIAELADRAVGFALYFPTFSTFLGRPGIHLEDLFVEPEFRGRGIGRALLVEVAAITRARGGGRLEWSVLDWNQRAISFYQRLDATPLPEWRLFRLAGEPLARLATG